MHINLLDIILLSVLACYTFLGLYRGMVISLLNIVSAIFTLLLTVILVPFVVDVLEEYTDNSLVIQISSFVCSYLLSSFFSKWIFKIIKEIVQKYTGGIIDRCLGSIIGAFTGYILSLFIFLLIAIVTSSSYIEAKNLWEVFHNIDSEAYPKWLKKASTYSIMEGSYKVADRVFQDSFIEASLKNIEMPSSPKKAKEDDKQKSIDEGKDTVSSVEKDLIDKIQSSILKDSSD